MIFFLSQGIRFLIDSSLLKNTSEDIAKFLYKGEGLNKTAIGDYLGERYVLLTMFLPTPGQTTPGPLKWSECDECVSSTTTIPHQKLW